MTIDDRFDDLAASLVGFHRTWVVYLGLELGLFERIRAAGSAGITLADLATGSSCAPGPMLTWALAAHASELIDFDGSALWIDAATAAVLLDEARPEYLGGLFVYSVAAAMDHDVLCEVMRTGRPVPERPPRYYRAIERLTRQDIAVFFEQALAFLPNLVVELRAGGSIADMKCGGGRWLVAMAQRFPETRLLGIESEPDSVARAMRNVDDAGLSDRIRVEAREVEAVGREGSFDLVYFQHALHTLGSRPDALAAAYRAVRPGGRLLVLSWCLPSTVEEYRTAHGEIASGIALDELLQGTPLQTREDTYAAFRAAGLPEPDTIELPAGATLFQLVAPGGA